MMGILISLHLNFKEAQPVISMMGMEYLRQNYVITFNHIT
jgi:hypothetical protein